MSIAVHLTGRLTAVPESKVTQTGKELCTFSVAVRRRFGKDDNGNPLTDFPNCIAFGQLSAFICRYFGKGDWISLSGTLQSRKYTDKNGQNRIAWKVLADTAEFCGAKNSGEPHADQNTVQPETQGNFTELPEGEDLPF
ncbi:MAG: single-stranded DNA-binding protein [Lachnospiraceae bacterium]